MEKSSQQHKYKHRIPQNPSFSSSLLDEIYRSIDSSGQQQQVQDYSFYCRKKSKDEKTGNWKLDNWTEKKVHEKVVISPIKPSSGLSHWQDEFEGKMDHEATIPFSNSSSSSDSSFGGFSSSETETFPSSRSMRPSCFGPPRPAPVRTSVPSRAPKSSNDDPSRHKESNHCQGYSNSIKGSQDSMFDEGLGFIRPKSKALEYYSHLNSVKQPISPGMRLSSFITSLFAKQGSKKSTFKAASLAVGEKSKKKPEPASACTSASSFAGSCMTSKTTSPCPDERFQNGMRRSVRFHPAAAELDRDDQDSLPCAQKSWSHGHDHSVISLEGNDRELEGARSKRHQYRGIKKLSGIEKSRGLEDIALGFRNGYLIGKGSIIDGHAANASAYIKGDRESENVDKNNADFDASSCSSSDLFELDHLTLSLTVDDELPVYETTRLPNKL